MQEIEAPRVLVIDNFDSFTFNLVQYLKELGARVEVRRNDAISFEETDALNPDGILMSPGPGTPAESGITMELIRRCAGKTPVLGVCLGHQAIGEVFGARLVRAGRVMHGKTSSISHDGTGVFRGIASPFRATRYNSLLLDPGGLPETLRATAWSEEGELMGISHRHFELEGVQFHPEAILSEHGHDILANWLSSLAA